MGTLIREAGSADVNAMIDLLRDVAAENRWVRTEVPFDVPARKRHVMAGIASGELIAFVAETDGAISGQLSLRVRGERAVFGMVVALAHRRRGLGRQLVTAAIARARECGLSSIELEVYSHNRAAIELYRSAGFAEHGNPVREELHDGRRWSVVRMRLALLGGS